MTAPTDAQRAAAREWLDWQHRERMKSGYVPNDVDSLAALLAAHGREQYEAIIKEIRDNWCSCVGMENCTACRIADHLSALRPSTEAT